MHHWRTLRSPRGLQIPATKIDSVEGGYIQHFIDMRHFVGCHRRKAVHEVGILPRSHRDRKYITQRRRFSHVSFNVLLNVFDVF